MQAVATPAVWLKFSDAVLILATLASPVIAIQVQKWLERRREDRAEKLSLLKALMATRASRLAPEHVQALNMIDVVFYEKRGLLDRVFTWRQRANKRVREAWKEYFDTLQSRWSDPSQEKVILQKREDLLVQLVYEIAQAQGYDFDKAHIRSHGYSPIAHGQIEDEEAIIRRGIAQVLLGQRSIPMAITSTPEEDPGMKSFREAYTKTFGSGQPWPIQIVGANVLPPVAAEKPNGE